MRQIFLSSLIVIGIGFFVPAAASASVVISEIMYDLPGTDTDREWIEVENTGSDDISFVKWKFFEADTNHGLTLFQGNATTSAGGFAIIADDPANFLTDNQGYSGTLFDSSFSLSNTGETLELKVDNVSVHQTTYAASSGAAGDGNSLHYNGSSFTAGTPTPGSGAPQPSDSGAATPPHATSTAGISEQAASGSPSPPAYAGSAWVYTPQIYVSATVPQKGTAGASVFFDAIAIGIKKEPIQNARYVWSFGDGGTAEGKRVSHIYHYPGAYVVMVTASSGEWSATDRSDITILTPELSVSKVKEGSDGFIELHNVGTNEVDLSFWMLKSGTRTFTIPQGTVIRSGKIIPFPSAITSLSADPLSTALLYPNGNLVTAYVKPSTVSVPLPVRAEEPKAPPAVPEVVRQEKQPEQAPRPAIGMADNESMAAPPIASSTELLGVVVAAQEKSMTPWVLATALIVALSIGGYLLLRAGPKPTDAEQLQKEAAEYDIME